VTKELNLSDLLVAADAEIQRHGNHSRLDAIAPYGAIHCNPKQCNTPHKVRYGCGQCGDSWPCTSYTQALAVKKLVKALRESRAELAHVKLAVARFLYVHRDADVLDADAPNTIDALRADLDRKAANG
jgi:hypothetical protein